MSNEADFDAYGHEQAQRDAIVKDYADALGWPARFSKPLCETTAGERSAKDAQNYPFGDPLPLGGQHYIPPGPSPDPTPSQPLLVGLTLRRIPDGGVLVTALDGEVVFCASVIEEALEYVSDRFEAAAGRSTY